MNGRATRGPEMTWKSGRAKSWGQASKARVGEDRGPPREPDLLRSRLAFSGSTPSDRRQVRWLLLVLRHRAARGCRHGLLPTHQPRTCGLDDRHGDFARGTDPRP